MDTNRMNYYKWTTTQSTNQNYDIVVQVPIPSDFSAWASNPLAITTYTSNTSNGTITLEARDSANAVQCNFVSVTPGTIVTWATNTTACTLSAGTYTAGNYMTLRIRVQSPQNGDVRVGNIVLNYLSKY
jgi:plastocyanin